MCTSKVEDIAFMPLGCTTETSIFDQIEGSPAIVVEG